MTYKVNLTLLMLGVGFYGLELRCFINTSYYFE